MERETLDKATLLRHQGVPEGYVTAVSRVSCCAEKTRAAALEHEIRRLLGVTLVGLGTQ